MSSNTLLSDAWLKLPQRERDAAYDNRAAVVAADALIVSRNEASRALRSECRCYLDVPFGSDPREAWDIFPGESAQAPCLVFVHGGYWQRGDRKDFSVCARGALEMGWSAAICGYPLSPGVALTQIVHSIPRALDWLSINGPRYGVSGPIVLSGWSAGGHLAAMSASHPAIAGVLCICGLFDLAPIRDTYLNASLSLTDQEVAELSPLRLRPVARPMLIAYGAAELPELQRQSCDFYRMRAEAGSQGSLLKIAGANHFTVLDGLRSKDTELLRAARELLSIATTR